MRLILRFQISILLIAVFYILMSEGQGQEQGQNQTETEPEKQSYAVKPCKLYKACRKRQQKRIAKKYLDLFITMKECWKGGPPFIPASKIPQPWRKFSECCPSKRWCTTYKKLKNVFGIWCYIVELPRLKLYQFQRIGVCQFNGRCRKSREGKVRCCTQMTTFARMLAICPSKTGKAKAKIHLFNIPSCCECK